MDLKVSSFNANNYPKAKNNRQNVQFGSVIKMGVVLKGTGIDDFDTIDVINKFIGVLLKKIEHTNGDMFRKQVAEIAPDYKILVSSGDDFDNCRISITSNLDDSECAILIGEDSKADSNAFKKVCAEALDADKLAGFPANLGKGIAKVHEESFLKAIPGKSIILHATKTPKKGLQLDSAEFVVNA